jgi:hypothetical protein
VNKNQKQIWLSLYSAAYLIMVTLWLSPPQTLIRKRLMPVIRPILMALGLDQTWMMFCPTVRDTNYYINSTITFADGSTRLFEPPRLYLYDLMMRVRRQRMNKAFLDAWERPAYSYYWPYIAAYIARCNLDQTNEPILVSLSINWALIPPIEVPASRDNLPAEINHATYFVYKVRPEDLK